VYYNGSYTDDKKTGIWEYFNIEGESDTTINCNE
jgi:hypothetical protein